MCFSELPNLNTENLYKTKNSERYPNKNRPWPTKTVNPTLTHIQLLLIIKIDLLIDTNNFVLILDCLFIAKFK